MGRIERMRASQAKAAQPAPSTATKPAAPPAVVKHRCGCEQPLAAIEWWSRFTSVDYTGRKPGPSSVPAVTRQLITPRSSPTSRGSNPVTDEHRPRSRTTPSRKLPQSYSLT
jgi:hypothetical protein